MIHMPVNSSIPENTNCTSGMLNDLIGHLCESFSSFCLSKSRNDSTSSQEKSFIYNPKENNNFNVPIGLPLKLLTIPENEWIQAIQHFKNNPNCIKLKKNATLSHSFIQVNNTILALANRKISAELLSGRLGEGTWGNVKVVQNYKGENFAVKVEARGLRKNNDPELIIMKKLHYYYGEALNLLPQAKLFKNTATLEKLYTVTELFEDRDLFHYLYEEKINLDQIQKLLIGLKICLIIHHLHSLDILHVDIKPENFMMKINGYDISMGLIDFGLSKLLQFNQNKIISNEVDGTIGYIAPEINFGENLDFYSEKRVNCVYSVASDVWAIGRILRCDLKLPEEIWANALNSNWRKRATLPHIIFNIVSALEKIPNPPNEVLQSIAIAKTTLLGSASFSSLMPAPNLQGNKTNFTPLFNSKKHPNPLTTQNPKQLARPVSTDDRYKTTFTLTNS